MHWRLWRLLHRTAQASIPIHYAPQTWWPWQQYNSNIRSIMKLIGALALPYYFLATCFVVCLLSPLGGSGGVLLRCNDSAGDGCDDQRRTITPWSLTRKLEQFTIQGAPTGPVSVPPGDDRREKEEEAPIRALAATQRQPSAEAGAPVDSLSSAETVVPSTRDESPFSNTNIFYPTADTFIGDGKRQGVNYGSRDVLELKKSFNNRVAILKFDIIGNPRVLSDSATTTTLRLHVADVGPDAIRLINVTRLAEEPAWEEDSVTWSNFDPYPVVEQIRSNPLPIAPTDNDTWVDVDVGDLLAGAVVASGGGDASSGNNVSLVLMMEIIERSSGSGVDISSRESGRGLSPELVVEPPAPVPADSRPRQPLPTSGLVPFADTFIGSGPRREDVNFGTRTVMKLKKSANNRVALLKFDLSNQTLTTDTSTAVTLRLRVADVEDDEIRGVTIVRLTEEPAWEETTVTWSNFDPVVEQIGDNVLSVARDDNDTWVEVDVTDLVAATIEDSTSDTLVLMLEVANESSGSRVDFSSRETVEFAPQLFFPGGSSADALTEDAPSGTPSTRPSTLPSPSPSTMTSANPSATSSLIPSGLPSSVPSLTPSAILSSMPSALVTIPSVMPSVAPSAEPSEYPSFVPSAVPSSIPSALVTIPSTMPSVTPSAEPSANPSFGPSSRPSDAPSTSQNPTGDASGSSTRPSPLPSNAPTMTSAPSARSALSPPILLPTQTVFSAVPSSGPTYVTSEYPSTTPTSETTIESEVPSRSPIDVASSPLPSYSPTQTESASPSASPSASKSQSEAPSAAASESVAPSGSPSNAASASPSLSSTPRGSDAPSSAAATQSSFPSVGRSAVPSIRGSLASGTEPPSLGPSADASSSPSYSPTWRATAMPSLAQGSIAVSISPSVGQSTEPSGRAPPESEAPSRTPSVATSPSPSSAMTMDESASPSEASLLRRISRTPSASPSFGSTFQTPSPSAGEGVSTIPTTSPRGPTVTPRPFTLPISIRRTSPPTVSLLPTFSPTIEPTIESAEPSTSPRRPQLGVGQTPSSVPTFA